MATIASWPDDRTPESTAETAIPALVAQVYASAPAEERCRLVETLLRQITGETAANSVIPTKLVLRKSG